MAETAVNFLIDQVKELIISDIILISGAKAELEQLKYELALLKGFLEDAAKKSKKEETFQVLERQIEQVVYEAEYTIDCCINQRRAEKERNIMIRYLTPKRLNLAKQVNAIRVEKVTPMFNQARIEFANLQIADGSEEEKDNEVPLIRERNIVGFEEEAESLFKDLTNQKSDELDVISIIGMPGLGKTTLAWKLYGDPRFKDEFTTLIWVYISEELDSKEIYLSILKKFTEKDMTSMTEKELAQTVRTYLETTKFLLFVDNLWTTDAWNIIQFVLTKSNKSAKVLIISRDENVAWFANRNRVPCKLRLLNPNESWELLQLEVFGNLHDCPIQFQTLGKSIAGKCDGHPLAIVVIGKLLVNNFSTTRLMKKEWERVSNRVRTHLYSDETNRIEKVISSSFRRWPKDLLKCFLYLGVFPEESKIPAWKLKALWIAEGFINQNAGRSLEETADSKLKLLVDQNLVLVEQLNPNGEVKTLRVHSTILEFCRTEGGKETRKMFQEFRKSDEGVFEPPASAIEKYRRICVDKDLVDLLLKNPKGPLVRSFLCFSKEAITLPDEKNSSIPTAFSSLRVLEAESIQFTRFPNNLGKLHHLKYLTLSFTHLRVLPEAIFKLWNIQTLKVDTGTSRTLRVEADILNMTYLRHFKTNASTTLTRNRRRGEAAENLRSLTRLSIESCTEEFFARARNIKTLGICGDLNTLVDSQYLATGAHIEKLKLIHDVFPEEGINRPVVSLLPPENFPPKLKLLTLSYTCLDWSHMITLGKIRTLEVLKLKDQAFVGDTWRATGGGFLCLEVLQIVRNNLEIWTATSDAFPRLSTVELKDCERLKEIPFDLEQCLQSLTLEHVTKAAVSSARRIEQAKQKMQGQRRPWIGGFKLQIAPGDA